jgi:Cdc6-like AAA superfamily ATPase
MLGYEDQMREMLRDSNPGLARRFQIEDAFKFEDYTNEELLEILDMKMKKQGVEAKSAARMSAIAELEQQRNQPHFGNGGAVENLLGRAILNMHKRNVGHPRTQELIADDFGTTGKFGVFFIYFGFFILFFA